MLLVCRVGLSHVCPLSQLPSQAPAAGAGAAGGMAGMGDMGGIDPTMITQMIAMINLMPAETAQAIATQMGMSVRWPHHFIFAQWVLSVVYVGGGAGRGGC